MVGVRVSDFSFELPEALIAQHPPAVRGSSRMLVVDRGTQRLSDDLFAHLPERLRAGDLLVLNDSRVLPARLFATRAGLTTQASSPRPSGQIEVLLTEEVEGGAGEVVWNALVKPARKVVVGERLDFRRDAAGPDADEPVLTAEVVGVGEYGERTLRFRGAGDLGREFFGQIEQIGHMPLPPYIRREQAVTPDTPEDRTRYQTVFSETTGSAAAPTAGLHFTPEILAALVARGVEICTVTLHVGLGTFQPVRVATLAEIRLHAERYTLSAATAAAINRARAEGRRIVAVGTTTTRTLEHIAGEAGEAELQAHSGRTSLFLSPGYRFRIVSGLLTNFHLPASTLLMLVSAFAALGNGSDGLDADPDAGRRLVLGAYAHAIERGYRFYSYGDCMLLL